MTDFLHIPKQSSSRIWNSLLGAWRWMDGLGDYPAPFEEAKQKQNWKKKNGKDCEY